MKRYFVFNYDGICYVGNSKKDSDFLSMACYFSDSYEECERVAIEWTTAPIFELSF